MTARMARQYLTWRRLPRCWAVFSWRSISLRYEGDMVKRMQHIGTFLHNEMGISLRGISPMCGRSSIHLQKIFFLRSIAFDRRDLPPLEPADDMLEDLDLHSIADDRARQLVRQLLNLREDVMANLRVAHAENQRLRDEINRLKGEQGRPAIKSNQPQPSSTDHSSEQERRKPKGWSKGRKIDRISIDRAQVVQVDPDCLPPDAQFKGYEEVVVQDVVFRTDNVLFHKEKFYSPSQHQTYLASLPQGYNGQFGPGIKSLALVFYYGARMSEPKVAELLRSVGVQISDGQVSNLLIKDHAVFHAEKAALYQTGLASSPWQHLDDTSTRVNGQNGYCHIVCNPLYTAYFTTATKDRLTVIDVLTNHRPRRFLVNAEALDVLEAGGLSAVRRRPGAQLPGETIMEDATMQAGVAGPPPGLGPPPPRGGPRRTAAAAPPHAPLCS